MVKLTVEECMSPAPYNVRPSLSLAEALTTMDEHRIRHLPVVDDGVLIGVLSERDLQRTLASPGIDASSATVSDAARKDVYTVEVGTSLREVAANMYSHKYGSTIVLDNGRVAGVFTTVDALHALVDLLA